MSFGIYTENNYLGSFVSYHASISIGIAVGNRAETLSKLENFVINNLH